MAGLDVKELDEQQPAPAPWLVEPSAGSADTDREPREREPARRRARGPGRLRGPRRCALGGSDASRSRCAGPEQLEDLDGAGDPGRREHDDRQGHRGLRARASRSRDFAALGPPAARDLRRADRARPQPPRPDGHRGAAQRVRAPGEELRGGRARARARRRAAAGGLHPGALDRALGRRGGGAGRDRRPRGRRPRSATCSWPPSTPS